MTGTKCIICGKMSERSFEKKIFSKAVNYYLCPNCDFLFTQRPADWLPEAYSDAITFLDLGLVNRNLLYSEILAYFIKIYKGSSGKYLDFGGGYGLLTRIMRDKGFEFYRQDSYCENLFARHFDISDTGITQKFDLLTAFEVFEHLDNPLAEIENMFRYSDTIFFSTELKPTRDVENWYYLLPEIGQHISFYSRGSLNKIAEINGALYIPLTNSLHILSKAKIPDFKMLLIRMVALNYLKLLRKVRFNTAGSLLSKDFEMVKQKLTIGHNH